MNDRPHESFPNYTWEMYYGNEPAGNGHMHVSGEYCKRWEMQYGNGETAPDGVIIHAHYKLSSKVSISIIGNALHILDVRYAGKTDFWEFCVNHSGMPGPPCVSESSRHQLEPDRVEKYLSHERFNNVFGRKIQARAIELAREGGLCLSTLQATPTEKSTSTS